MELFNKKSSAFIETIKMTYKGIHLYQSNEGAYYFSLGESRGGVVFPFTSNSTNLIGLIRKHGKAPRGKEKEFAEEVIYEMLNSDEETIIPKEDIFIRSGRDQEGNVIIDLGRSKDSFVVISKTGMKLENKTSIPFRRSSNMKELPAPLAVHYSDFRATWNKHFQFETGYGSELLMAFVAHSIVVNNGPNPYLVLQGEQGSGKSTTSKRVKSLIDPSTPLLQGLPRKEDDLVLVAKNNHFIAFDNLSYINAHQADLLCRLATKGGLSKRKHYSDEEIIPLEIQKPLLFNGISEISSRSDFLDRAIKLKTRSLIKRQTTTDLEESFNKDVPKLLYGIYMIIQSYLSHPREALDTFSRMGEYIQMGLALDRYLERKAPSFLDIYHDLLQQMSTESFEEDPLCLRLEEVLEETFIRTGEHEVKAKLPEMWKKISLHRPKEYGLDYSPRSLKPALERIKPLLKKRGIEYFDTRSSKHRMIVIKKSESLAEVAR